MKFRSIPSNDGKIVTFDVLKGMMIAAIVLIHLFVLSGSTKNAVETGINSNIAVQFVYGTMMMFFVMAGYFFRPGRGFINNAKKRILQIFVPLIICGLCLPLLLYPYLVYVAGIPQDFSMYFDNLVNYIVAGNVFQGLDVIKMTNVQFMVNSGYYFLRIMVCAFIIFYAIGKYVLADNRKTVASIIIMLFFGMALYMLNIRWPFNFQCAPVAVAFMIVGAWAGERKVVERFEAGEWKNRKWIAATLLMLVVAIALLLVFPTGTDFNKPVYGAYGAVSVFPYFVITLFAGCVMMYVALFFSKIPYISMLFFKLGGYTLIIMLLQEFVIKILVSPFYGLPAVGKYPVMPLGVTIVVWIACIVICVLIEICIRKIVEKGMEKRNSNNG